jgi:hypothetical protein
MAGGEREVYKVHLLLNVLNLEVRHVAFAYSHWSMWVAMSREGSLDGA